MTERGLPGADGTPACPFVAFADEREERSDRPDHRHRCFAEEPPAPRAAAHQEAYCLSSAFPVCPTFQDWARREAAHARATAAQPQVPPPVAAAAAAAAPIDESTPATPEPPPPDDTAPPPVGGTADDIQPYRNPPRDWAAPPPWAGSSTARPSGSSPAPEGIAPAFLAPRAEGQGLAGSPADRMAGGAPADPSIAALVGGAAIAGSVGPDLEFDGDGGAGYAAQTPSGRRPAVSSTRPTGTAAKAPPPPRREHVQSDGPSWERQRRYEAYPTIKTRSGIGLGGLANLPRVGVLALALVGAAVTLFFLPALLGVGGGDDDASASPSQASVAPTSSPSPTPVPAPTPQVYVIKSGDTLSGIAAEFGVSIEELLAANLETIPDPDLIAIGDEIIIPAPPPDEVESGGGSAEPEESVAP